MFVNLHNLPSGKSMYTVYVTLDPQGTPRDEMSADEVDVVAGSSDSWTEVVNNGKAHPRGERAVDYILDLYGGESRIVGVVNQSEGYIVYDAFKEGDEG